MVPYFQNRFGDTETNFIQLQQKTRFVATAVKMFSCVTMANYMQLQHFWPNNNIKSI